MLLLIMIFGLMMVYYDDDGNIDDDDDDDDDENIAQALVEEVTDYAGWCVCSLDFIHVLNSF